MTSDNTNYNQPIKNQCELINDNSTVAYNNGTQVLGKRSSGI